MKKSFPFLTHPLQPFNLSEFPTTEAGQINNTRGGKIVSALMSHSVMAGYTSY